MKFEPVYITVSAAYGADRPAESYPQEIRDIACHMMGAGARSRQSHDEGAMAFWCEVAQVAYDLGARIGDERPEGQTGSPIVPGDITPPTIPTPQEARATWLAGRTDALRAFVCERMSKDPPPYRLDVDLYPEEARQAIAQECRDQGWGAVVDDVKRTTMFGVTVPEYTVRIMKVWQP